MLGLPFWAASIIANLAIIVCEYVNRTSADLPSALVRTWPLIVLAQVCLWAAWNGAPSLMIAWAVFFIGSSLARLLLVTTVLGEPIRLAYVLAGVAIMGLGSFVVKLGTEVPK